MARLPDFDSYFDLEIKSAALDRRAFTGIATTRKPDRIGDVVEPKGAQFKLPLPLLRQHRQDEPIGQVTKATVTDGGIEIEAEGPRDTGLGYLEEAWAQIRARLVKGLSIGFKPIPGEVDEIKDDKGEWTGGLRFKKWEWLELSAVTIPANPGAKLELRELARGDLRSAHDRELRRALLDGRYVRGDSPSAFHVKQRAAAAIIASGRTLRGIRQ
jgi:HK97 family phage prohead protease